VDLHEKRQLDLANHLARVNQQVAKAKVHAQPWRAIIAGAVAVLAGGVASQAGTGFRDWTGHGHYTDKIVAAACIAAFFIFGTVAVVELAGKARQVLTPAVGSSHAAVVRYAILLAGGVTVFVLGIGLMKVPIAQLLVGGAVTTILLGIAGQQSLSNIFAGLVLLLSRPFLVGDYIRLKSGALGGVTDGMVAEIGIPTCGWTRRMAPCTCPIPRCSRPRWGLSRGPGPGSQSRSPGNPYRLVSHPGRTMTTRRTAARRTDRHDAPAQWCFAS
jgi:small-conductance mechanosensitive channel